MNGKLHLGAVCIAVFFEISAAFALDRKTIDISKAPLGLEEVILLAEQYSPSIKAGRHGEREASEGVRIGYSAYYPTLDFVAVDSTGFPASASVAPFGFNGLMMSPFRDGLSGGVYSTLTLFDLTREYRIQAAKSDLQAAQGRTGVTRLQVDLNAMNLYLNAMLNRTQHAIWKQIQGEIERLYGVIQKFVRSGESSEVTQWLLKYQLEQALQKQKVYDEAYQATSRQIEILIGAAENSIALLGLETTSAVLQAFQKSLPSESPLIAQPRLEAQTFVAFASQQSAQNWPRLLGLASAGALENARLVPLQNYSAWIGLTFPLFEGFRISAQEQAAHAAAARKASLIDEAKLALANTNTQYAEQIKAREIDVEQFKKQKDYARKALKLSEYRYHTFVGHLADVRDSLYSYEAAASGLSSAEVELIRAKLAQAIVNGATLE